MQEPVVDRAFDAVYLAEHSLESVALVVSVEPSHTVLGLVTVMPSHQGGQVVVATLAQQLAIEDDNPMSRKYGKHHGPAYTDNVEAKKAALRGRRL
jgi:hypothetical protein